VNVSDEITATVVVARIANGDFDDDLDDVYQAIVTRTTNDAVEVCWRIDFDGLEITEENQTVGEARLIEGMLKRPIGAVRLVGDASAISAAVMAALIERNKMKPAEAENAVNARTARELLKMLDTYLVPSPPKDDGGSEISA
jgi:hypothetical protein